MTALPDFDTLWDYDQPAQTEQRFRELLPLAESSGDAAYHAALLSQIARAQGLQRQFEAAHGTLDRAERLLDAEHPIPRIRCLLERGRVYNTSKRPAEARPLFLAAWELAQAVGEDAYEVDAAHMMAIIEPPAQQMAWNLKALALAESSEQPRARQWLGSLYNNIGWTYHDAGDYPQSLTIFQKALAWRETQGNPNPIRIAKWCVGRALRSLNRLEEALALQTALLEEHNQAGSADGYVHEELAECFLLQGKPDLARSHFAQAYHLLSQEAWLVENEAARLERLKTLSEGAA